MPRTPGMDRSGPFTVAEIYLAILQRTRTPYLGVLRSYERAAGETHRPSDQQTPAGAMDAGLFWFLRFILGTGRSPSPTEAAAAGGRLAAALRVTSGVAERHGDEAR